MKKVFLIIISTCILGGCATAPQIYPVNNARTFNKSYDEVWAQVIEYFATKNIPIKTIEKASGIIAAETARTDIKFIRSPSGRTSGNEFCDCGRHGLAIEANALVERNVFVRKISDTQTEVRVNTNFRCQLWVGRNFQGWSDCNSTGLIESRLLDYLDANLNVPK